MFLQPTLAVEVILPFRAVLVLDLMGLFFLLWILNLVRHGRLYVGYGVIFIAAILGTMVTLSVPQLLLGVTHLVGAIFPASALTLLALAFIVLMLLYVLSQLTLVSNRLAVLIQELAIERSREKRRDE
jgi:ABC-type multidrug transport system fused ATPase/permease subunit